MARHHHDYHVINVKRSKRRGYVIVKYKCMNRTSYCPKPIIEKEELI